MTIILRILKSFVKVIASVIACSSISFSVIIVSNVIVINYFGYDEVASNIRSDFKAFIAFVVVSPVIETLIFQKFLIGFVGSKVRVKDFYLAVFSSFLFGLSHYYNVFYMAVTAIVGFIFCWSYLLCLRCNIPPFVVVLASHLLTNLMLFILIHKGSGG